MSLWYYERYSLDSWWPVTVPERPETRKVAGRERIRTATGIGPGIRGLTEVPACLSHLTLGQLAEVVGTAGRFRAVAGVA